MQKTNPRVSNALYSYTLESSSTTRLLNEPEPPKWLTAEGSTSMLESPKGSLDRIEVPSKLW